MFAFLFVECTPASKYMQCTLMEPKTYYTILDEIRVKCSNLTQSEMQELGVVYRDYEEDWSWYSYDVNSFNEFMRINAKKPFSRFTIAVKPIHNLFKVEKFATIEVSMIPTPQ